MTGMPIPHDPRQHQAPAPDDPTQFWEQRYNERTLVWSGRVNQVLAAVVGDLTPGRALDLGCGEGGDALWLAGQGWEVTGVDISTTAVERARTAARAAGITDRLDLIAADLASWQPESDFELVSACFLQSPVALDRSQVLRAAAAHIPIGGHLLVVSHAAPPPWASGLDGHHHSFLGPEEELAALGLPESDWRTVIAEIRRRSATGPDGTPAVLDDTVVLLQRY